MADGYFITGTDTGVGKSWCSAGIMEKLRQQGRTVVGMKPVASGCAETESGLRNEDALLLQKHCSLELDYALINPYAFAPPIAPHIAAAQTGQPIKLGKIVERFIQLKSKAQTIVVEGVGGWLVPLNEHETVADLANALKLPVVLVVGVRLGCINHALLSAEAIHQSGCTLAGWVANCIDAEMTETSATIDAIAERIDAPLIGTVPYRHSLDANEIAGLLNI